MTEETKKELVSRLVAWAKRGGRVRKPLALACMAVCRTLTGQAYGQSVKNRVQQENLRELVSSVQEEYPAAGSSAPKEAVKVVLKEQSAPDAETGGKQTEDKQSKERQSEERQSEERQADGKQLEGKAVMQSEDDEYYLHHDFYGQDSRYGCLYVRRQADLEAGTNFIIYGHNMKDGSMFGDLDLYLNESFYKEHPVISFDTIYEERTYDIVAVFRSQVYNEEDEVFKYYQFYEADTQEAFDDFYNNIKELSLYDTGVEAQFGDTFLTLSTCAYHVPDGRLVVVAKRRE